MFKALLDRLTYALIGLVLGALLAVVLWFLYGAGFSLQRHAPRLGGELIDWVKLGAAVFAGIGFVFKSGVGSAVGGVGREAYRHEARPADGGMPIWMSLGLLALLLALGWFFFR